MILKRLGAKALLGAAVLAVGVGSVTAMGLPVAAAAAAPMGQAATPPAKHDTLTGIVISVSDQRDSMVVEVTHRDKATRAVTKDDLRINLTDKTRVFLWSDRHHRLGLDALKPGERVHVRYAARNAGRFATRIVLLPAGHRQTGR